MDWSLAQGADGGFLQFLDRLVLVRKLLPDPQDSFLYFAGSSEAIFEHLFNLTGLAGSGICREILNQLEDMLPRTLEFSP